MATKPTQANTGYASQGRPASQGKPKTNAQGYDPIKYGAKGEKTGIAKVGQARNQPGFVPRGQRDGVPNVAGGGMGDGANGGAATSSYLTEEQQRRIQELLGDSYNANKPLNIQLFKAKWESMTDAQKRVFAKKEAGKFIEGGPSVKTLSQFKNSYLDELQAQNVDLQRQYDTQLADYSQEGGGFAQSGEQSQANIAYWKAFAASPEGQAHIAATGMTQEDWLSSTVGDMKAGAQNYRTQQSQFGQIQTLASRLGIDVPGFTAPGWASTLEGIKAGRGPLPSADYLAMYPGSAADLVGVENTYQAGNQGRQGSQGQGQGGTGGEGVFQPFTNFTGVQQPDTFSERDLYQNTQYR